jgi:hypothetical protein
MGIEVVLEMGDCFPLRYSLWRDKTMRGRQQMTWRALGGAADHLFIRSEFASLRSSHAESCEDHLVLGLRLRPAGKPLQSTHGWQPRLLADFRRSPHTRGPDLGRRSTGGREGVQLYHRIEVETIEV